MQVNFSDKFGKDILYITNERVLGDIVETIERIKKASKPQEITNIKKLKGSNNSFRIRIGNYRIGITIEKNIVTFIRVLSREIAFAITREPV